MSIQQETTYIIPFRQSQPERQRNLDVVLGWLSRLEMQVVVVEQDDEPRTPLQGHPSVQRMFLFNPGPFNKSWAVNCAAVATWSRYLVVGDADLIMARGEFLEGLGQLKRHQAVSPFSGRRFIDLNDRQTEELGRTHRWGGLSGSCRAVAVPFAAGIVMFEREALLDVGGYPEDFSGWGGEDDVVTLKIQRLLEHIERPWSAYHLFHDRAGLEDRDGFRDVQNRVRAINMLDPNEFRAYCDTQRERMGNPDECPTAA